MKHGFVKVAAATPDIKVADCTYNAESVCRDMKKAAGQGAKIVVFPELCLTGYTCSDLFWAGASFGCGKRRAEEDHKNISGDGRIVLCGAAMGSGSEAL